METEIIPLNAVVDPMLTRAKMQATTLVKTTAFTGSEVLLLTCLNVNAARFCPVWCLYLAQLAPSGETLVSCKSPADA